MSLRRHIITLVLAAGVALGWVVVWLAGSGSLDGLGDPYRVRAVAPSVVSLAPGARVNMAGVDVGKVSSMERRGDGVLLELELDDDHPPVPRDSRFGIRLHTLVGENYVELYPGESASELADGGVLPMSQANQYVEIDEILSVLRGETREGARRLIRGLGRGVRGRGDELNRLVDDTAGTITASLPITRLLARDRRQVARLIENFGDVSRTIGQRGDSLVRMANGMRVSFESLAQRDDALRAMLDELPSTLRQVRDTSGTLRAVTADAAPVLENLGVALHELQPAVALLRPAAREGRGVMRELARSAPPLEGTLRRLRRLSGPAASALPQLQQALCQFNPAAAYLSPYAREIGAFFASLGSTTNYYDATGHAGRLMALVGEDSYVGWDDTMNEAANTLVNFGFASMLHRRGWNPYPAPGQADDIATGNGGTGPWNSNLPYTRVQAEC